MTASLTQDIEYKEDRPNVQLLMQTDFTKEIRISMKEGHVMKEHSAPYPIVIEIFEGQIDFGVNSELHKLKKGDLITLSANVPHDLKALENSIVRLTLSKGDMAERVENVCK